MQLFMKKPDITVRRETGYISIFVFFLSAIMELIFLIIGKWDYTVVLGNLLCGVAAVGNFFLMGMTVQSAVEKEEKDARNLMKLSQSLRLFMLLAVLALAALLPCFNIWAAIPPLFFPRIAVAFRPLFQKRNGDGK